jgi:hypothetical protein
MWHILAAFLCFLFGCFGWRFSKGKGVGAVGWMGGMDVEAAWVGALGCVGCVVMMVGLVLGWCWLRPSLDLDTIAGEWKEVLPRVACSGASRGHLA